MGSQIQKAKSFLKKNDPVLAKIIARVGKCTLEPGRNYFESLTQSIMYQQLSLKAAGTIYKRLVEKAKKITPENILKLSDEEFRNCGVSKQKIRYLRDLSAKFHDGTINWDKVHHLDDDELIELLSTVKGIGRWTAEMFLMFTLNRLDIFPVDDLGLQRAIKVNYRLKQKPDTKKMLALAKKWKPYRTIASWYLWKSLEGSIEGWD